MRIILAAILLTFFAVQSGFADSATKSAKLKTLFDELEANQAFNGAVMVWDADEILMKRTVGYADIDKQVSIDDQSSFELGSITKTFTAIALYQLQQVGKVDLNAPITNYFPDLPYPEITAAMMLSHASGLYDVYEERELREKYFAFYGNIHVPYSNQDYFDFVVQEKPRLLSDPLTRYKYSNTAYVILGLLVEKVSGQSFTDYIRKNILRPAEMSDTFWLGELENERNQSLVFGYRLNDDGSTSRNPDPDAGPRMRGLTFGDDDLISTMDDMYKYDRALLNGVVIDNDILDRMLEPVKLKDGSQSLYAQGFRLNEIGTSTIVDHTGSTSGFYAYQKYSRPNSNYGIILFLNVTRGGEQFRALQKSILNIMEGGEN